MIASQLFLVSLDHRQQEIEDFDQLPLIRQIVVENLLPPLCFAPASLGKWIGANRRIFDPQASPAGFSDQPEPHVVLTEKFFSVPSGDKMFVLGHELRHAYQALIRNTIWQQFRRERQRIMDSVGVQSHDLSKFLGAPLEVDAQQYMLRHLPDIGSDIIAERAEYIAGLLKKFPSSRARTMMVCFDLLPQAYEWQSLIAGGLLVTTRISTVQQAITSILSFLATRTQIGSSNRGKELCLRYQTADATAFLGIAEEFYQYLSSLKE